MGKSLKTQLKESVNNDNLPILDKIEVNIGYVGSQTGLTSMIRFQKKSSAESLNVEFDTPIYDGDYAGSYSPINVSLAGLVTPYFAQKEGGATVKFKSVYGIKTLLIQNNMTLKGADSLLGFVNWLNVGTNSINVNALKRNNQLIGLYCSNNLKDIVDNLGDKTKIKSILGHSSENIQIFNGLNQCTSLQIISGLGNIEYLPASIREIWCGLYSSGEINTFIANMRAGGRTSGVVKMHNLGSTESITYNGQRINEYFAAESLNKGEENYVKWNASNIYILDSQPADYVAPENIENYTM